MTAGASLTRQLAEFALADIEAASRSRLHARARIGAIDTIGCALAGLNEPVVRIVSATVPDATAGPSASVWGMGRRVGAADAAFLNAVATHALDFDDNMPTMRGHPSTTMLPAALAAAESVGASGAQVLDAYAVAVEMGGKLGLAMGYGHYGQGWHPTATIGIYGATAAAARLLGLDASQLCHAWGVAASQASGLISNFGTMTKPFHAGHAARSALTAVLLARSGFTANAAIFDEPGSVFATYARGGEPIAHLLTKLGAPWEIEDPGLFIKLWPCCYCSHRPISGLLQLMQQHDLRAEEIDRVRIGFPPGTDAGLIKTTPATGLAAKFSVEYTAAALLLDGNVTLTSFTDDMLARPAAQALMSRVHSYPIDDGQRWSSTVGYNEIAIETPRGCFTTKVDETPGSPQTPMPDEQLDAKFLDCASASLEKARARQALGMLRRLGDLPDIRALSDCLRNDAAACP